MKSEMQWLEPILRDAALLTDSFRAFPEVPAPFGAPIKLLRVLYVVTRADVDMTEDLVRVQMTHGRIKEEEYGSLRDYWAFGVLPVLRSRHQDSGFKARALFEFERALCQHYSRNGRLAFTELQELVCRRVQRLHEQVLEQAPRSECVLYVPPPPAMSSCTAWADRANKEAIQNWMFLSTSETEFLREFTLTHACEEGMPYERVITELHKNGVSVHLADAPGWLTNLKRLWKDE